MTRADHSRSWAATGDKNQGLWFAFKQLLNMITFIVCLESGFTSKFLFIFTRAEVSAVLVVNMTGDLMFQIMLNIWYVC